MLFNNTPSCLGLDAELFFAPDGGNYLYLNQVKKICGSCKAKDECFEYAIDNAVQGLWAGTTHNERDIYRAKRGIMAKPVVPIHLVRDHIEE